MERVKDGGLFLGNKKRDSNILENVLVGCNLVVDFEESEMCEELGLSSVKSLLAI